MRKIIYTFYLLLFLGFQQSIAQEGPEFFQDAGTVSFGPRAGLVTSILNIDTDGIDNKIRVSYIAGAFLRYQINKRFALQLDVAYAERGGSYTGESITGDPDFALGFIDPQLTAVYDLNTKIGKNLILKWNLFGGFQPSILVRADFNDLDVKDNLKSVGFDLIFGSSIYIKRFILSATTKIGLSDLNDNFGVLGNNTSPKLGSLSTEWTVAYRLGGIKK